MNLYFLDAGGAGLIYVVGLIGVLFVILATLLEAVVMILMKYNIPFKKAFVDSVFANICSLLAGFVLLAMNVNLFDNGTKLVNLLVLYLITVAVELVVLYGRNRTKPFAQSLLVCAVMNLVSYALLYFLS